MPYCQNCGAEISGNFCPNCGAQSGSVATPLPKLVIHENAVVKPRYSTGALVLAGYLGFIFLMTFLIIFITFTVYFLGGTLRIWYCASVLFAGYQLHSQAVSRGNGNANILVVFP